ncbi:aldose 1-epimerase [Polaribacter sp. IC073]|uniref:aldose 1-epimerase n=1 Tax=Polaribacter sp. IC073 TaxID=2508540 RepID=UPI0011BD9DF4|nr:aldose 1-epimerase [Polaribacter sp. IC073]TXD49814.1 aldose 1-epimerase [Polaribacter sp. IC073]
MFKVHKISQNGFSFLELKNSDESSIARISLNEGGRLQEFTFNNIEIVKDILNFEYKNSYASAILFPFANRIENGKYIFNDEKHQFKCNEGEGKNALHGLVYNKEFQLKEEEIKVDKCAVMLCYQENKKIKGFPFTYAIYATYTLTKEGLSLSIKVKNTDTNSFPFTLGWHPYFFCEDLHNSSLNFASDKKIAFDKNLITKEIVAYKATSVFKIEDKQLDDCFILENNKIDFNTAKYQLEITSNVKENFLQMYTPKGLPLIAIEPMTGVSNSLNNKIGLQVLEPNTSYSLTWNVKINNN